VRQSRALRQHVRGVARNVSPRALISDLSFLQVDGKGDVRDAAPQERRPARQMCDVLDVRRPHDADAVLGDIGEDPCPAGLRPSPRRSVWSACSSSWRSLCVLCAVVVCHFELDPSTRVSPGLVPDAQRPADGDQLTEMISVVVDD